MNRASNADRKIDVVETIHDPDVPINRPKKKQDIKLKNGNIIIHKYIISNLTLKLCHKLVCMREAETLSISLKSTNFRKL